MAKIQYNGPKNVKRVVGEYTWEAKNKHVVEVKDQKMVKTLLEQPDGEFTLAEDEKSSASKSQ